MKNAIFFATAIFALSLCARTVSVDTVVCNPGMVVETALSVDVLSDAGAAVLTVNYNPNIVVCLGLEAGEAADASRFTYADTGAGQIVVVVPAFIASDGAVAKIRFLAREGTQGCFSDITVASADFAAKDGVSDLTVVQSVNVRNGMIRVMAEDAAVARLEESFTVWADAKIGELTLGDGDSITASDGMTAIKVARSVTAQKPIMVRAPLHGWQTGRYALVTSQSNRLEFVLEGMDDVNISFETANGVTTYFADIAVEGMFEVVAEDGELDSKAVAAIRSQLAEELSAHSLVRLIVKGDVSTIPLIVDLGIHPAIEVCGAEAFATYAIPSLKIVAFNPKSGLVRIKVTPGEGNTIKSQLVSGCIHVYGTKDLSESMRYISGTAIDVSDYLCDETKGEADLTVKMGAYSFVKVKVENETKNEGDTE